TATVHASWSSGNVAPGGSQSWVWNNANPAYVFTVGFNPAGASATEPCRFETTRTWYVQQPDGEYEFHFQITNVGGRTCGTMILLNGLADGIGTWSTGSVASGASVTLHWNNAADGLSYLAGFTPSGATGGTACQFEITRGWYVRQLN